MTNNKQHILLAAVAAAWFAKPSYADTFTSTWTSNLIRHGSDRSAMELDLHAQLNRKVHGHDRDMMADEQTFIGPGVMECNNAVCTFEVDESLGCADPCHTVSAPRMYEYPFYTFSDVSDPYYKGSSEEEDDVCYYRKATDITTWKPELAQIDVGCTARCTGCTFASPVVPISGPTTLQCNEGRCTKYVHGETFGCGTAIEAASGAYGTLATLPDGEHVPHEFHGFEGINGSFEIPDTCNLECTGCIALPNDSGTKTPTESASTSTTSATTETESTSTSTTSAAASDTTTGTNSTSSTGTDSPCQTTTTTSTTTAASETTTGTDSTSPTTTENTTTRRTSAAPETTSYIGTETATTRTELTSSTGTHLRGGARHR